LSLTQLERIDRSVDLVPPPRIMGILKPKARAILGLMRLIF
jgi:hypothetical protein